MSARKTGQISLRTASHWVWTIPLFLIVAWLAIRQIEVYPPSTDEFFSMFNAGWLGNHAYSPIQVVQSLQKHSPDHTPLYFVLLSIWGQVGGTSLAVGRLLSVFISLVAMAIACRLAKDFIAPIAGLMALLIISSNAFYNYYLANARMYPLLVASAGAVLWIYLRLVYQARAARTTDYLALAVSTFCLLGTHAFSIIFLAMVGVFHLLFVPKNLRWLRVSIAVGIAALLFSPYYMMMLDNIGTVIESKQHVVVGAFEAIEILLAVGMNERPELLLISVIGLAVGTWRRAIPLRPFLYIFILYLLSLGLVAESSTLIVKDGMRYHLAGFLPLVLLLAGGIYGLYRFRRFLGLLVLLWLIAGIEMQANARWWDYIVLRSQVFTQPPTHILSRLAAGAEPKPAIFGYPYNDLYAPFALEYPGNIKLSQREHYFGKRGIVMNATDKLEVFREFVADSNIDSPVLWYVYPDLDKWAPRIAEARNVLGDLRYAHCASEPVGHSHVITRYMWESLECAIPDATVSDQNELISLKFYTSSLDDDGDALFFVDEWSALGASSVLNDFKMSYQLINDDWDNKAQVDLPFVHESTHRRFSIDLSRVPAGSYRLMAIAYNRLTGKRLDWINNTGYPRYMLLLDEIAIAKT
ncbi:MAG: hypothetical protein OXG39_08090 [Chloroflexi bacterium]|nr:hypothetical protein [Chloroflexota bacterium]